MGHIAGSPRKLIPKPGNAPGEPSPPGDRESHCSSAMRPGCEPPSAERMKWWKQMWTAISSSAEALVRRRMISTRRPGPGRDAAKARRNGVDIGSTHHNRPLCAWQFIVDAPDQLQTLHAHPCFILSGLVFPGTLKERHLLHTPHQLQNEPTSLGIRYRYREDWGK